LRGGGDVAVAVGGQLPQLGPKLSHGRSLHRMLEQFRPGPNHSKPFVTALNCSKLMRRGAQFATLRLPAAVQGRTGSAGLPSTASRSTSPVAACPRAGVSGAAAWKLDAVSE
jgi:hypothetical protein